MSTTVGTIIPATNNPTTAYYNFELEEVKRRLAALELDFDKLLAMVKDINK
jgi:hypothetical protein